MKKKQNAFKIEPLIEEIWCDVINGLSKIQIYRKLCEDQYKSMKTSVKSNSLKYRYIGQAFALCEVEDKDNREMMRNVLFQRLLGVYNDSFMNGDRRTALETLKYIGKCFGIEDPDKFEVNGILSDTIQVSFNFSNTEVNDKE